MGQMTVAWDKEEVGRRANKAWKNHCNEGQRWGVR